mgnify:CR=1 FL=1
MIQMPDGYDPSNDEFLRPGFNPDDARPDFDAPNPNPPPRPGIPDYPDEDSPYVDPDVGSWDGSLPGFPAPPTESDDFVEETPIEEPTLSLFTVEKSSLSTKTYQYGGAGANCRSESTDWGQMPDVNYWAEGSLSAEMNGNTLSLRSWVMEDAWMTTIPDEFMTVVVADDSYVEMNVTIRAGKHYNSDGALTQMADFVESFDVCLEGGDSISATVGDSLYNISLVKGGVECISSSMIADLNSVFTEFTVTMSTTKAVYCSYMSEADLEVGGGEAYEGTEEWTQTDSWVLLGAIVALGLILHVRSSLTGGEGSE